MGVKWWSRTCWILRRAASKLTTSPKAKSSEMLLSGLVACVIEGIRVNVRVSGETCAVLWSGQGVTPWLLPTLPL